LTSGGKVRTSSRTNARRPHFLIVGAAKAGTTSLYSYLRQHPQLFLPSAKEPSYFVEGYGLPTLDSYLDLFDPARDGQLLGEASTPYLSSAESAEWIRSTLGQIKIIVILRNPARRAFSLYNWMAREGYESAATFEEGLSLEDARARDAELRRSCLTFFGDYLYFNTGLYHDQLVRFFDAFGRQSVLVLLFEEFVADPGAATRTVLQFLGVQSTVPMVFDKQNEGRLPRSIPLQFHLRNLQGRAAWLRPTRLRYALTNAGMAANVSLGPSEKPKMPPRLYDSLLARYRDDIERTSRLVGRDLSLWTAPRTA
jgi:hypothetical protein